MPLKPANQFCWDIETEDEAFRHLATTLSPEPSQNPPEGWTYPQAPIFKLNDVIDRRFRHGRRYASSYDTTTGPLLRARLCNITTPPNAAATLNYVERQPVTRAIPGMTRMVAGVPFVQLVNGDPDKIITIGCLQTLRSLDNYAEGVQIRALIKRLQMYTWGCPSVKGKESIPAIFTLPGMTRNDRSGKARPGSNEGSYNLASTILKGHGTGILVPATQASHPQAVEIIGNVLKTIHELYRLIMPLCISREEWDVMEFHQIDNNTFSFAGLDPGPIGCQMNVSEGRNGQDLTTSLGDVQGSWHVDFGDDPMTFTLMVLLFRLPPGKSSSYRERIELTQ
jgi:hypothetical protein